jgi:hypothetical protein
VQNLLVLGSADNTRNAQLMRLRESTAGAFANILLVKGDGGSVVRHDTCDDGGVEDDVAVTQSREVRA